jgi:hypothetical protein
MSLATRWRSACAAFRSPPTTGGGYAPLSRLASGATPSSAPPSTRIAELAMDVAERDQRIAALVEEAAAQREAALNEAKTAADDRMHHLLRRLSPLIAQGDAMRNFHTTGQAVRVEDALTLLEKIEQAAIDEGLVRIGTVGEETIFDSRWHQRLSGGDVRGGDQVVVRFAGFRQAERVVAKALVSRKE